MRKVEQVLPAGSAQIKVDQIEYQKIVLVNSGHFLPGRDEERIDGNTWARGSPCRRTIQKEEHESEIEILQILNFKRKLFGRGGQSLILKS